MKRKESLDEILYKRSPLKLGKIKMEDEDDTFCSVNKIINRLWLGDYHAAKNKSFFKKNNIKAVLNCTKNLPNSFVKEGVEYMRIPVDDSLQEIDFKKMYNYFPVIIEYLHKCINIEKKNVLVHCVQGKARSCIAVAVYLLSLGLEPDEALKLILKKRPDAFFFGLSLNFKKPYEQFITYYKKNPRNIPKYKSKTKKRKSKSKSKSKSKNS